MLCAEDSCSLKSSSIISSLSIDISPCMQQACHHFLVATNGSSLKSSFTYMAFSLCIDISTCLHQAFHCFLVATRSCSLKSSFIFSTLCIDICPCLQQAFCDVL